MTPTDTLEAQRSEQVEGPRRTGRGPRTIRAFTPDDWFSFVGALLSSFAVVEIGYLHLLDLSGMLGFGIIWYMVFLVIYGTLVSVSNPRPIVVERLVTVTLYLAAAIVMIALGSTIVFTFVKGWNALTHLNFYTHDMSGISPTAPLTQGGIYHALVGTVVEVGVAVLISVPLGIGTAVYMTEIDGRLSRLVRTVIEAMTALPEILAALFVYAFLVIGVGLPKAGLAVSVAMAVTMVPITARAGEVALRVVPSGLREASNALGATHWKTVRKVVLPAARAGLATAIILSVARAIGETAVPLILSGASSFTTYDPMQVMNSLPLLIYTGYTTHEPLALTRAFGAASVLLTMVLILFIVIRLVVRDKGSRSAFRVFIYRGWRR
jgi:phosphate transport system permease protein